MARIAAQQELRRVQFDRSMHFPDMKSFEMKTLYYLFIACASALSLKPLIAMTIRLNLHRTISIMAYLLSLVFSLCMIIILAILMEFEFTHETYFKDLTRSFAQFFTNPVEEVTMLVALIFIFIFPQVMAYLISGLCGCASPPKFTKSILKYSAISMAKGFAMLAGILLSGMILYLVSFILNLGPIRKEEPYELFAFASNFLASVAMCLVSVLAYYHVEYLVERTKIFLNTGRMKSFHQWMTRNVIKKSPPSVQVVVHLD